MAKYNYLKNIGFTCCGLVTIFALMSLFFPKLLSIGHQLVCEREDNSKYHSINKISVNDPEDDTKYGIFNIFHIRNRIKHNANLKRDDEIIQKLSEPLRIAPLESIQENYNHFPNLELNGKDVFKFNIKLNSFSKESSDLLD